MAKSKCKVERRNSCNREKVLIDGQQRITAMAAAIVGQEVLDSHYKWKRVCIAFNPPYFSPYFRRNAGAPASPARRFGTSPRNRRSGTSEKSGSGRPPRRSRRTSPLTAPTAVRSMPSRPPRHIAVPVRSAPDRQGSHATWPDNRGSSRLWHAER